MEVIEYEEPRSWDDKGMDWENPDPRNADYVMAIRNALFERAAAAHAYLSTYELRISPNKAVNVEYLMWILDLIRTICHNFFNPEFTDYKEDFSDFPHMWTYGELVNDEECRMCDWAKTGDLLKNGGAWLKTIKNALDKLTIVRCWNAEGETWTRSGSEHDPPFDEAIGKAMDEAFDEYNPRMSTFKSGIPSAFYAWSGNTHWKCPRPDTDGEDNVDGYCGYAESIAYRFTKIASWVYGAEFDFLAYMVITEPKTPVSYSVELQQSVFDAGDTGLRRGINVDAEHVEDPDDVNAEFGYLDCIPQNEVVPTSDFDSEGNATHRRSAKRGYDGSVYFFLDYGCKNGFAFRAEKE